VKVTINGEIDAKDNYYSTDNQTPVSGNVISDSPVDSGTGLSIDSHTNPSSGTLSLNEDGSFTYTPDSSFEGNVSFEYTIKKKSGFKTYYDTARVFIEVKAYSGKPRYDNRYSCGMFDSVLVSYDSITSASNNDKVCGNMQIDYPDGKLLGDGEITCYAAPDCTGTTNSCGRKDPPANRYEHSFVDSNVSGDNSPVDPGDSTADDLEELYYGNLRYSKNNGKKK
jgi:hypothetical protein